MPGLKRFTGRRPLEGGACVVERSFEPYFLVDDTSEGWEVAVAVMHQFRLAVPGECCCNDPELVGGLREVFSF